MDASTPSHPNFYDFLNRMRHPASADLVRAIKSFIVSFSFHTTNAENGSRKLQDFLTTMEATIKEHPLWARATDEDIDSAIEYATKELQKINAFKAPREKLLCIMSCCRVINNLLLNMSLSTNHTPAGADDFLPVLIYVTIRANPPQLHSNLKFIQLFRWHSKLVSEAEYYLTNLISAKSFITSIDASSLSMDTSEFEKNMQAARLAIKGIGSETTRVFDTSEELLPTMRCGKEIYFEGSKYPFMDKEVKDLTGEDVRKLLGLYKQVVTRYTMLSKAIRQLNLNEDQLLSPSPLKKKTPKQTIIEN